MIHLKIEPYQTILVLNSSYEPINLTNWRRAIVLLIKNKAQVLSSRVIRLFNYVKLPMCTMRVNLPTRTLIYKRDDNICQYCGATSHLTIDHIIPRSKGGLDTWENLVTACYPCNTKKGDRFLIETNLKLSKQPKAPSSKISLDVTKSNVEEWMKYVYA